LEKEWLIVEKGIVFGETINKLLEQISEFSPKRESYPQYFKSYPQGINRGGNSFN